MKGQCRNCMERREVFGAQHKGGGSYRRGSRFYRSSICLDCAQELLKHATFGHRTVAQWSISDLRRVVERSAV